MNYELNELLRIVSEQQVSLGHFLPLSVLIHYQQRVKPSVKSVKELISKYSVIMESLACFLEDYCDKSCLKSFANDLSNKYDLLNEVDYYEYLNDYFQRITSLLSGSNTFL